MPCPAVMLSEVSMFPALLVAPEPGLLWEELLWEWGSPFWPCPGLLNSSFTPGFASSLSCKFGKALCAVSRVTAAEMGSQIVWVSPAKTPMGLEIWDFCGGTGSCQMDASHSLWPAGSPSSPGQPKGHSSCSWPAGIAHRQPFPPHVQSLSSPAVVGAVLCFMTEVTWDAGAWIPTHAPSKKK